VEPQDRLARHTERFAAGDQDGDLRAAAQHGLHRARDAVEQVFGVVEAQQRPPGSQMRTKRVQAPADGGGADGLGDGLGHRRAVTHRGEVNPPDAVGMPIGLIRGDLRGQPCLARAARPGQGHEPVARQQSSRRFDLRAAPDERRQLDHKVVRHPGWRSNCLLVCAAHGIHNARDPARATRRPSATTRRRIGHLADDPRPCDVQASVQSRIT